MYFAPWLVIVTIAFTLTLVWAVVQPDERVYVTGGLSFLAWSLATLAAPGLELLENGEAIPAGSTALVVLCLTFAFLSGFTVLAYHMDLYPPKPADGADLTEANR
jgi:hypothetical protein